MTFKLGKLEARPDAVKLKLADYLDLTVIPPVPTVVGHQNLLPTDSGVLGNDQFGDCVFAGAGHETMLWNLETGKVVEFTDQTALSDYSAVTGFDTNQTDSQGNNPTDNGTDMQVAASYRRKTGVVDAAGVRHKIDAYLALTPGNIHELRLAIYLFGAVGVGVKFPGFWMDQFNAGKSWYWKPGAAIEGGHYIPAVGSAGPSAVISVVSWGKVVHMTPTAYKHYNDESIAYVSLEALSASGKSLEGFNIAQLEADLKAITTVK